MAKLYEQLPTEMDGRREVDPVRPAPSIWENLANAGSKLVHVADTAATNYEEQTKSNRVAADNAAKNDVARIFPDIISGINSPVQTAPTMGVLDTPTGVPGHDNAVQGAKDLAPSLKAQQTAAAQGATPPNVVQARSEAAIRQLIASHPGHEMAVAVALKELGITSFATKSYERAEEALTAESQFKAGEAHAVEKYIVESMGVTNYFDLPAQDQYKLKIQAGKAMASEHLIDTNLKQAQILQSQSSIAQADKKDAQQTFSQTQSQLIMDKVGTEFDSAIRYMTNLISDPKLSDPDKEKLQTQLLSVAIPNLQAKFNQWFAPHSAMMTADDRSLVQEYFKSQIANLNGLLTGPTSIVEQNKRQLEVITDQLGIDTAKAAPLLMRMKAIVGPNVLGTLLGTDVIQKFGPQIKQEFSNAAALGTNQGSQHLVNFLQTLSGEADMKGMDPKFIRDHAPLQIKSMIALAQNTTAWNGTDKEAHNALVNSVGNTAAISTDAVPQWGFHNLVGQMQALTSRNVYRAIAVTPVNTDAREKAIKDYIPGVQNTYFALSRVNAGDPHYSAAYNPSKMQWEVKWDGKTVPGGSAAQQGAFSLVSAANPGTFSQPMIKPNPSEAVLSQVRYLNLGLDSLTALAAHGHDPFLKGVNTVEARRYYATGEIPASITEKGKSKDGKSPSEAAVEVINHIVDNLNKLPAYKPGAKPPTIDTNSANYKEFSPIVREAAKEFNVPEDLALRLINHESGFNPNAVSKKGAKGLGQIMDATAKLYGFDVNSLSAKENARLAMRILSDNHAKTGTWEDALAMYQSGVDLATAAKQGRHDGNQSTIAYVGAVGGSSISAENLARHGYVRY